MPNYKLDYTGAQVNEGIGKAMTALQEHQSLAAYRTSAAQDIIDNAQSTNITNLQTAVQQNINQWDEMWEVGYIDPSTGQDASSTDYARSKGYIKAKPSTTYYSYCNGANPCNILFYGTNKNFLSYASGRDREFTTPSNCAYIRFYTALANITDISINYPSSFTGYYPSGLPKTNAHIGGLGNVIGMRGWNQLVPTKFLSGSGEVRSGVTVIDNGDGSVTLNGTATDNNNSFQFNTISTIVGHKYCFRSSNSNVNVIDTTTWTETNGRILTATTTSMHLELWINNGRTYNNDRCYPQLFDLTAMGLDYINSVADFRAMFPAEYYPYCNAQEHSIFKRIGTYQLGSNTINISLTSEKAYVLISRDVYGANILYFIQVTYAGDVTVSEILSSSYVSHTQSTNAINITSGPITSVAVLLEAEF